MNERIQELVKQARNFYLTDEDYEYFAKENKLGSLKYNELINEKFAELIVRECAEVSENYADGSMPLSIALAIKKHFGVDQ